MKHGCCVDRSCNPETCMSLPRGETCGNCVSFMICSKLVGPQFSNDFCDWFPRRFKKLSRGDDRQDSDDDAQGDAADSRDEHVR